MIPQNVPREEYYCSGTLRYSHSRCVKQEVVEKRLWSYRTRAQLDLVYRDTLYFNVQPLGTERWFPRYLTILMYLFCFVRVLFYCTTVVRK